MKALWHHLAMAVDDIERAKSFYCDTLGFELDWEREHYSGEAMANVVGLADAAAHVVMLKGYGTRIELFRYHNPKGRVLPSIRQCDFGLTHFALAVQDLSTLYADLAAQGVLFNCPPQNLRPGVRATYMKDPEGNTIELVEYEES